MNYISIDNTEWTARISGQIFTHTPRNGGASRTSTFLTYKTINGWVLWNMDIE